jgi:nitrite reductase/ring-hydroxylating ferredoxin subunit
MSENTSATRRNVIVGTGAGGLAAVLAACGGSGSTTTGAPAPANSGGASGGALASTSAIPVGGGEVFKDQKVVVTQPEAGTFKAFSATCTHQGCTVGSVTDGVITCPCHGSKFIAADGSVKGGPATKPLPEMKINVSGDQISLS